MRIIKSSLRWPRRAIVYDFALPMLLLHGLKSGRTDRLIHWLNICPRKQFTTLDTHDGIGVVDVAGLLTEEEIDYVRDDVDEITKEAKQYIKLPSMITAKDGKFKSYQLGSTYYSALRCSDRAYLIARARTVLCSPVFPKYITWASWQEKTILRA